ncbi:MAG: ABC transporter permease subunit [Bifidobacteriaceae bacterium]|jgi:multiple sugar transport system permease protein|nr:ABC transporter permease subunit [Bifidobacteriaceae bacterium]
MVNASPSRRPPDRPRDGAPAASPTSAARQRHAPADVPDQAEQTADPEGAAPTASPNPTGPPASPNPTERTASPNPTERTASPNPTGPPASPNPTGPPASPNPTGPPASPSRTERTASPSEGRRTLSRWRRPRLDQAGRRAARRAAKRALPFALPFAALFLLVYVIPIVYSVYQSLFAVNRSGLGLSAPEPKFAGLANYARALSDPDFLGSLKRVLFIGVVQVPVMLLLALALALLIDAKAAPGTKVYRVVYFLPYALPGVIAGLMWSFLYAPSLSPIVRGLEKLGLDVDFTADGVLPFSIMNILTWAWTGYNMIIIYSSLQSIPQELMEAAAIDGASKWKTAWRIKVPMVRPAIILTAVFSIIGTAQLYNEPVTMKAIAPNLPSDYTPIMSALKTLTSNYPYSATKAVILALLIGLCSALFFRVTRQKDPA